MNPEHGGGGYYPNTVAADNAWANERIRAAREDARHEQIGDLCDALSILVHARRAIVNPGWDHEDYIIRHAARYIVRQLVARALGYSESGFTSTLPL